MISAITPCSAGGGGAHVQLGRDDGEAAAGEDDAQGALEDELVVPEAGRREVHAAAERLQAARRGTWRRPSEGARGAVRSSVAWLMSRFGGRTHHHGDEPRDVKEGREQEVSLLLARPTRFVNIVRRCCSLREENGAGAAQHEYTDSSHARAVPRFVSPILAVGGHVIVDELRHAEGRVEDRLQPGLWQS